MINKQSIFTVEFEFYCGWDWGIRLGFLCGKEAQFENL